MEKLVQAIEEITEIADDFGLDYFPMRYEICPDDAIYTFGAYGMPTRFSHWSFGKQYHKMKVQYDLGLSKIYELVINSDPCYAYLLNSNSLVQNKMIAAHVLGHSDFFKNNAYYGRTNREMVTSMAATAERIQAYEYEYGKDEVEQFLDAVLSIQEHIDPYPRKEKDKELPDKDLLYYIQENSRYLKDWQRDIITMMREEMLYFWPQMETKIMNEGWASFWHLRIMRELDLTEEETVEFAKLHAGVISPQQTSINPYRLGLRIFEDIDERYGREKVFEVREVESDTSFLRNYLTKEIVEEEDLYLFQKQDDKYEIVEKQWESVRDELIDMRVNGGFPYLVVEDGDYCKNGELYIRHAFEGIELDVSYLEKTIPYIYELWGRTVHIETVIDDREVVFSSGGGDVTKRYI
ncbi:SpoVR family protein [Salimicrobium halophilum]|uniref:Stage V sporulation protein R n=1 Tax=Salimicrobium halophilum TaxID=86666 RepID=A0A1G8TM43_9BACI|nr:SpoVR family protein [Salimicrobium halophilum]SDJ41965.1 stage V sporulation protein R [Salimicrobium halophilum]